MYAPLHRRGLREACRAVLILLGVFLVLLACNENSLTEANGSVCDGIAHQFSEKTTQSACEADSRGEWLVDEVDGNCYCHGEAQ